MATKADLLAKLAGPQPAGKAMGELIEHVFRVAQSPGIRLAAIGDSLISQNHKGDAIAPTSISNETNGELTWARLTNPSFLWNVIYDEQSSSGDQAFRGLNEGVSGEMTADVLARVNSVIAKKPDVCFVAVGTNDIAQVTVPVSFTTITENILAIVEALREAGIIVILSTIGPRPVASWALASDARKKFHRVNAWIRDTARRLDGVYIHDRAKYLTNATNANGEPITGVLKSDGVHLAPAGARLSGIPLGALLAQLFPGPALDYQGFADDVWVADDNPTGNLLPNGRFIGTGGTPGTGASGVLTTNYTLARTSGSTVTCVASKETDAVLGELQVMTFTLPGGGSGNDTFMLSASSIAAGLVEGDYAQAGLHLKIDATPNLVDSVLFVRNSVNSGHSFQGFRQNDYGYPLPNAAIDGPIMTEPFICPASPAVWTYRFETRMPAANSGSVVIKVGNAWARKVADPRSMWNNVA